MMVEVEKYSSIPKLCHEEKRRESEGCDSRKIFEVTPFTLAKNAPPNNRVSRYALFLRDSVNGSCKSTHFHQVKMNSFDLQLCKVGQAQTNFKP